MRVEWTSYDSPVGILTLVECEAGPLVIEYPNRAVTIKWAVRLRAAVPELHIAQGSCRVTSSWLNNYFAGSPSPTPSLDHLKHWFDLSPAQMDLRQQRPDAEPGEPQYRLTGQTPADRGLGGHWMGRGVHSGRGSIGQSWAVSSQREDHR